MITLAVSGSLIAAAAALLGAVFPDSVERIFGKRRARHHRCSSHWFAFYLAGFCGCFRLSGCNTLRDVDFLLSLAGLRDGPWRFWVLCAAFWFAGGLLHVVCDAFCGKVPFLTPFKRSIGWHFFRMSGVPGVMSRGELIFVAFLALSCLCLWIWR